VPQKEQIVWDKIGLPHLGQAAILVFFKAKWEARRLLEPLVLRFGGTDIDNKLKVFKKLIVRQLQLYLIIAEVSIFGKN